MHVQMCICLCTFTCICTCTYVNAQYTFTIIEHVYIYIYTRTRTYTCTHIYMYLDVGDEVGAAIHNSACGASLLEKIKLCRGAWNPLLRASLCICRRRYNELLCLEWRVPLEEAPSVESLGTSDPGASVLLSGNPKALTTRSLKKHPKQHLNISTPFR